MPLLLVAAAVVVTRTPLTDRLVLAKIRDASGMDVRAGSVVVGLDGEILLRGFVASFPGEREPVLHARRVGLRIAWGSGAVKGVTLVGPVLRVVRERDGTLNLGRLPLGAGGESEGGLDELPELSIFGGKIVLLEDLPGGTSVLRELLVDGSLRPEASAPGRYRLALREGSSQEPMLLRGTIDNDAIDVTLEGADLRAWTPEHVPSEAREAFRSLDLVGRIGRSRFTYTDRDGVGVRLALEGVDLNLPVPREPGGPEEPMRLRGVTGAIHFTRAGISAQLAGRLEDLPVRVTLDYKGFSADAPFDCEIVSDGFLIARNPRLLPYAPELARYRLGTFSNPTAEMDARVRLTRAAPSAGAPAEVRFAGTMHFRNGEASFEKFPYPFREMEGVVRFDNDKVEIVRITGVSDTGASLFATGSFAPPDSDPETIVDVRVVNAPLDEVMRRGLGPGRDRILDALCNAHALASLEHAGLVQSSRAAGERRGEWAALRLRLALAPDRATGDALRARIAELERELARPVFDAGGSVDVVIRVRKKRGESHDWTTGIDLHFPVLGLVPEDFPFPILGRDVRVEVDDHEARVVAGRFEGIGGGEAAITATLPMADGEFDPVVNITGSGVRVDPILFHAIGNIPGARGVQETARILGEMGARGTLGGDVRIFSEQGSTRVTAGLAVGGWSVERAEGDRRMRISGEAGSLVLDRGSVTFTLDGQGRLGPVSGASSPAGAYGLWLSTGAEGEWGTRLSVRGLTVDAEAPFESFVEVIAPEAARKMRSWRAEHGPRGTFDAIALVHDADDGAHATVTLSSIAALGLDTPAGRVEIAAGSGSITIETEGEGVSLGFDAFEGLLRQSGKPVARASADGRLSAAALADAAGHDDPSRLVVSLLDATAESPFARALAGLAGIDRDTINELDPRGSFGAVVSIAPRVGRLGAGAILTFAALEGSVRAQRVTLTRPGAVVRIEPDGSGTARGVALRGQGWEAESDFEFMPWADGWRIKGAPRASATALTPGVRALLPGELLDAFDALTLDVKGPVALSEAWIDTVVGGTDAGATVFDGFIGIEDASLEAGVEFEAMTGSVRVGFERTHGRRAFELDVRARTGRAAGVTIEDARAIVESGEDEAIEVVFEARSHGGRLAGDAWVGLGDASSKAGPDEISATEGTPTTRAADPSRGRGYRVRVEGAGLIVSGLMEELGAGSDSGRGMLDGELTLEGVAGGERRGRGTVRVGGGEVLRLPLVMLLVEFGNLQLPLGESLDYAEAAFFVDEDVVVFEELSLFSRTIALFGFGTMTWPDKRLDMEFRSKAARPIPLLSRLIEGVRDELVSTRVRGTLADPSISLRTGASDTRRVEGGVISIGAREAASPLAEIERRARERRELRRAGDEPAARGE